MHTTVLRDKQSDEESTDVYVYRLAKKKADKIGQVTRLIKETAVDCLLNIGQTNFTIDKLNALAQNQNIKIELSTNKQKLVYKIGDKPHTDICDYMDSCQTKCMPDVSINKTAIIQDTYSTEHTQINNIRLMQRIRQLFRDPDDGQHFFKLSELIKYINAVKQYPIEQIYAALNSFINNKNEVLIDKYGRRGNLINKNKLYAFQPIEINDEGITVFERSVPVNYKRDMLVLENPPDFASHGINEIVQETKNPTPHVPTPSVGDIEKPTEIHYKEIMDKIEESVYRATEGDNGIKDWYYYAHTVINHLQLVHEIGYGEIVDYIIQHAVDVLLPTEKLVLISRFYSKILDESKLSEDEQSVKEYMDKRVVTAPGNKTGVLIAEKEIWKLYIPSETVGEWVEADKEDIRAFTLSKTLDKQFGLNPRNYATMMGFINMFKSGKEMVFRVKDLDQLQNNTGSRIEPPYQIKQDNLIRLNKIMGAGKYEYTAENTKELLAVGICASIEILLRHRDATNFQDKKWFFNPEEAMYNKIKTYRIKGNQGFP
jgi:hypothetical protein